MLDPARALSFGAFAPAYHQARPRYPDDAVDWVLPARARRVLDLAAGTGLLTASLVRRGLEVVAVEPDPGMLAVLEGALPGVDARAGSAAAIPLADASVDAVVVGQAWHWFPPVEALAEIRRVLRPGGRLGLLWNARRIVPGWPAEVARLDPDHLPEEGGERLPHRPAHHAPAGLPADEIETFEVEWDWRVAPEAVRDELATHSAIAALPAAERAARLDAALRLAEGAARRAGAPVVTWPWQTLAVRWSPR